MRFLNKQLKTIIGTAGMVLMTSLFGMNGSVMASTPDGETPANEGLCDSLQGGTPGLYGLCVAYCEAQDLDVTNKEPPNTKILDNYRKKMQPGDPDMPCIMAPCPCWSDTELASVTTNGVAACLRNSTATVDSIQLIGVATYSHFAFADQGGRSRCAYVDLNVSPAVIRSQTIDPADATVCWNALDQACP